MSNAKFYLEARTLFWIMIVCLVLPINALSKEERRQFINAARFRSFMEAGTCSFYNEWRWNPGSCGWVAPHGAIVALPPKFMPHACGKCILVSHESGKMIKLQVTDTCPSCPEDKIDISDLAFERLDIKSKGILPIKWRFCRC